MLWVAIAAIAALTASHQGAARAEESLAAVYTMSNASSGNRILAFHRVPNGTLTPAGSFATGGFDQNRIRKLCVPAEPERALGGHSRQPRLRVALQDEARLGHTPCRAVDIDDRR